MSDDEPSRPDEDPLEELIRAAPPSTLAAIGEYAVVYMAELEEIAEAHAADPLLAEQQAIIATMRLIAGLSPQGSPGPAHVLMAPLLEAVLEMRIGTPPSLLRYGPPRDPARHPGAPHVILGRALAAAVMSMLMKGGVRHADATRLVASQLRRAGAEFGRRNSNPLRTIEHWRERASSAHRDDPVYRAYREMHGQLAARIGAAPPEVRQAMLLRALDQGVADGMFGRVSRQKSRKRAKNSQFRPDR